MDCRTATHSTECHMDIISVNKLLASHGLLPEKDQENVAVFTLGNDFHKGMVSEKIREANGISRRQFARLQDRLGEKLQRIKEQLRLKGK